MGFICDIVYDTYSGVPIDPVIVVEKGFVSTVEKGDFVYTGPVSNNREAHLVLLIQQLANTDLDKRVVEKGVCIPITKNKDNLWL